MSSAFLSEIFNTGNSEYEKGNSRVDEFAGSRGGRSVRTAKGTGKTVRRAGKHEAIASYGDYVGFSNGNCYGTRIFKFVTHDAILDRVSQIVWQKWRKI